MLSYRSIDHHLSFAVTRYVAGLEPLVETYMQLDTPEDFAATPDHVIILMGGPDDPLFEAVRRMDRRARLMIVDRPSTFVTSDEFDDLMFLPFTTFELAVRATRILKRSMSVYPRVLVIEDDAVRFGPARVVLSPTQCRLLAQFVDARGGMLTRHEILSSMEATDGTSHAIDARIGRLRKRLEPLKGVRIETVRQRGYRLVVDADPVVPIALPDRNRARLTPHETAHEISRAVSLVDRRPGATRTRPDRAAR